MVKIFMIDYHPVFQHGLKSILERSSEFQVVGDATNIQEALAKVDELQPDIVIMDIEMPRGEGLEAIALLQQKYPQLKLFILTDSDSEYYFSNAIKSGAKGYMLKSVGITELIDSIRLVASGSVIVYDSTAARQLEQNNNANAKNKTGLNSLSQREKEVLKLVAQGSSNKEIARHCFVSETTVKAHLSRILEKLNVKNRAQAVAMGMEQGYLNKS